MATTHIEEYEMEASMIDKPYLSALADRCAGHASQISYNGPTAALKHTLHEASHALDTASVRVHRKADGLLLLNARGKSRFMTWRERIAYALLGRKTEMRP
jgi:hypothetical protein